MTELKSFDRVAHCYDETRAMPPEVTAQVADAIAGVLRELAPEPRLLEVGIGTGRIAVPLRERGVRVTGIDISTAMLAVLRAKRGDIGVMLAEAARPPLKPGSFDAALFVHVLHLVPDAEATVRATLPLVRRGGAIIRGNEERAESSLDRNLGEICDRVIRDVTGIELEANRRYQSGVDAFEQVLNEAGCKIEQRCVATWEYPLTAREVLERQRRKDNSASWQVPDEAQPAVLAALEPQVVEVFGGLDVVRPAERTFELTVARLPAA